jgi:hypothetical protein
MSRKLTDVVQAGLRVRESLRRRLEKEAEKRGASINHEMVMRLERSFEADTAMSIDASAGHLANLVARLDAREHEANKLGDLVRAAEALLKQIEAGNSEATKKAAAKVKDVIKMIDTEAAIAIRRASTTGEGDQ